MERLSRDAKRQRREMERILKTRPRPPSHYDSPDEIVKSGSLEEVQKLTKRLHD